MKILKSIQIVLVGIILITSSGCNFLNWGDSGNSNDVAQVSGSVVVPTPEVRGHGYVVPDDDQIDEFDSSSPVPEPLTILLLGPGLFGLFAMYRKKKQD